ncbi:MAG: TrpB-like pyridoxal-phosphate dependent enzyme, partial [Chloroflexota bacterium]
IIPAPEPSHAIRAAIDEANRCKETGEEKNILFLVCGHGYFDMSAYERYLSGAMEDYAVGDNVLQQSLASVPAM